jgi:predicted PurR-regulated permease PerM
MVDRWRKFEMMSGPVAASYILSVISVFVVLRFHLVPAVFAGLAVHVLTVKLARRLPANWGGWAHEIALAALAVLVIIGLTGSGIGLWSFLNGNGGMGALLDAAAGTLEKLRGAVPATIAVYLPATVDELHAQLAAMMREHGQKISSVGIAGVKSLAHVLLGMVVGGLTALHHFGDSSAWPPLSSALHQRSRALANAFDKVVFAQVKISALNTFLTALYLMVILPLCGISMPLLTVIIPLTFVAGLLPVVGNLISNTAIVLISLGISPGVALASLLFLVCIHKLEYFTNARIVGGEVHARAWELLCAMLTLEAFFGVAGLVAAPVAYAWLKFEMRMRKLI